MPPKKEPCRNFMRGSCQYGDRCKFLHVSPQPSNSNSFGFGTQTGSQFQQSNPFGFGVQNNSQTRGAGEFGSKQNQSKPFENKWSRFSPINASNSSVSKQPDNQPVASSHNCTDPDSCKHQVLEDFKQERPLWKLTCYGHSKNGPCDIVGDLSYEELRAAAYDDAKRGLSLQSIVEKERKLLNSKLLELENFIQNPFKSQGNAALSPHNPFPSSTQNPPAFSQSSNPPAFSSFSQLGASLNPGVTGATTNNSFGQSNPFQNSSQTSSTFPIKNSPFGTAGSIGNQLPNQTTPQNIFSSSSSSFGNSSLNVGNYPFPTSTISTELFGSGPNGMAPSTGIHSRVTGATTNNSFGQSNSFQNSSQTSSTFSINNSPFGTSGSIGNQLPNQTTPQNIFSSSSSSFGNSSLNVGNYPFPTSTISTGLFGSGPNGMAPSTGIHSRVTGATTNNFFGQSNPFQNSSQTSSTFLTNNSPFGTAGSIGNQLPNQTTPQNIFSTSSSSFGNSSLNGGNYPFPTSTISTELFGSGPNGMAPSTGIHSSSETSGTNDGDNSIWMKEEWSIGEIPEEAPPDTYCR